MVLCFLSGLPGLSWGGSDKPWTSIRDALGTDEGFRLSVEWGAELWLEAGEGCLGCRGTEQDRVCRRVAALFHQANECFPCYLKLAPAEWSRRTTAVVVATSGDQAFLVICAIQDGSQLTETVDTKVCFCACC